MVMLESLTKRYRLTGLLGEGGMARVYRAEDTVLGRPVAVKVLRDQYAADPNFVLRFNQEARAAAGLAHPNVVNVYDVGEDAGRYFIVMELVEGTNLKDLVRQHGPLPPAQAVELGAQICAGVQAAHARGIVHRDIKPQNLLLTRAGQVKVLDFGIAQALSAASASETGQVLGSVHYLSPEQARGQKVTPASDLYQIGVVLYELLTGGVPFEADTPVGVALKHVQEVPTPPHAVNPRVPPTLSRIVLRALAKDPAERYASAAELGAELQGYADFIAGRTAAVRVPPVGDAGTRGRGDAGTRGRGEAVVVLASPWAGAPGSARPRPAPASRPSRGVDWLLVGLGTLALVAVLGLVLLGAVLYYTFAGAGNLPLDQRLPAGLRQLTGGQPTATPRPEPTPVPTVRLTPIPPTPVPRAVVPNLVGQDPAAAREALRVLNLQYQEIGEEHDANVPARRIARQAVQAGQAVEPGATVGVVLSLGKKPAPVPNVAGLSYDAAAAQLKTSGFGPFREEAWNATVPTGNVVRQAPAGNVELVPGSTVTLTVSRGPEKVQMPNVLGKPEADAKKLIESARLRNYAFVNYQGHGILPDDILKQVCVGCVLSTRPAPSDWVDPGTEVYMAVRKD